ncbi:MULTISPECIES: helix-turn-helix domain-containing protein [unclassified Thioalkalivibrio]|uniref:helix-turn-helix domain-containing protein n=1 Tax=unclassified Thioalkalivibrio TaxID=2621013 RepID=UPI00036B2F3A|nr:MULTISPECIES: helix-turn-helix domain-containing protein [unclassified Thioalkalivibrio]
MQEKDTLLTTKGLAELAAISERTVIRYRNRREGPPWIKVGGQVRYRKSDVDAWLNANRVQPVREVS